MKPHCLLLAAVCLALLTFHAPAATLYVDLNCTNSIPPYTNWLTAATNIQDAIDASTNGDLILVTNGVYATGGRTMDGDATTNRVLIDKAVMVQSVNGPAVTIIQGNPTTDSKAVRCVYMISNSTLSGFTVTNGGTSGAGGGVETTNNSNATITNCVLIGNVAGSFGGGVCWGHIYNCQIIRNSAYSGGGVGLFARVESSLLLSNTATSDGGGVALFRICGLPKRERVS